MCDVNMFHLILERESARVNSLILMHEILICTSLGKEVLQIMKCCIENSTPIFHKSFKANSYF